jgi:hypothetical protein
MLKPEADFLLPVVLVTMRALLAAGIPLQSPAGSRLLGSSHVGISGGLFAEKLNT